MNNDFGISLYLDNELSFNLEVLNKAIKHKINYVFTSINSLKEFDEIAKENLLKIIIACSNKTKLIVDVSKINVDDLLSFIDKNNLNKNMIILRLDYGFTPFEMASLGKNYQIALNGSVINEALIKVFLEEKVAISRVIICYNYYPKKYTGLELDYVKSQTEIFHAYGFKVASFVPECNYPRKPYYEGLPTIENHRYLNLLEAILESKVKAKSDIVVLADINCSNSDYKIIENYINNILEIRCQIKENYLYLLNYLHHNRIDYSRYVFRSVESREKKQLVNPENNHQNKKIGDILISNKLYLRYQGEVEIALCNLPFDKRVNICGKIIDEDIYLLKYLNSDLGVKFINCK